MKIAVVSGAWCTGKTSVANKLSELLGWSVFSLDFYKEKRFDKGETGRLIEESYGDLFNDLVDALDKDESCIIESDFTDGKRVQRLIEVADQAGAKLIQVFLSAEPKVLHERFIKRLESGERHPGHGDERYLQKAKASLESGNYSDEKKFSPLDLPGSLIEVDTTDFDKVDYNIIVNKIRNDL